MYARVITALAKPNTMDSAVDVYNNAIIPATKKQPGFKGANLLVNGNTAVSTTIWETEADMIASEASGYLQKVLAKLGPFLAAPPENAHYEVRAQV